MKKMVFAAMVVCLATLANVVFAHEIYIKKNPTNENGIEWGVDNATGFVKWRAYIRGTSNNGQGQNTGWTLANGWWYYNLDSITQRVMWRLTGLENQKLVITYWVFRSDGTWDYGPQIEVISDQIVPAGSFSNLVEGAVYQQSTFSIQATASDNLSGVAALRLYVVVPAGYTLAGWQPSGLSNEYYQEFPGATLNCSFSAPGNGSYKFTLWAKDKAGNINYQAAGPVAVSVDLPGPPPPPPPPTQPPAAPTNLNLSANGQSINLSWQDNATDEDGYVLYRNDQSLATLPANSTSYIDANLTLGQEYCYSLYAEKGTLNSSALTGCLTLDPPTEENHFADSFVYPLDCDKIYRLEADSQIPTGACFDYQPFGSLFSYSDKIHQGADLNLKGVNDLGAPVYAIGNALIWDYGSVSGWGNYLILRLQAASGQHFTLSDGQTATEIYALFAHLQEIRVIKTNGEVIEQSALVKGQTYVQKGWQIGKVGDANGLYSPHLHFEIRVNGYSQLGNGYWPVADLRYLGYFVDPIEFIENNQTLDAGRALKVFVHGYDRDVTRKVFTDLDPSQWQRQGRASDGLPLASVGWANHIWLTSSANNFTASWNFYVPVGGAWSIYTVMPRYYGQATGVQYQVWHSSSDVANPFKLKLDQDNNDENQKVFLGTFDFQANYLYSVEVGSQTSDAPAKNVAVDTLILVYQGDFGSGGGPQPDDDGGDPPPPNDKSKSHHQKDSGAGGCQISSQMTLNLSNLGNLLLLLSPLLGLLIRQFCRN